MNADEFKALFLPLHARLYRTAYALLWNAQDAEDIVQDAYLKLWRKRDELDIRTNPEAYCVSLIRRLCLDQLRSSRHEAEETLEDTRPLPADDDPGQRLEQRDETVRLKQLIAALPPTQRRVLWLRDVDERSFDEIEETTGLNAVNIRATLSRARKKIREQFKRITER